MNVTFIDVGVNELADTADIDNGLNYYIKQEQMKMNSFKNRRTASFVCIIIIIVVVC